MKTTVILGAVMVVIGAVLISFGHFSYQTQSNIFQAGSVHWVTERTKTVFIPPAFGWILMACGAFVVIYAAIRSRA